MQFLLLLSALLSAVTGAFAGPRAEGARVEQAETQVIAPAQPAEHVAVPAPRRTVTCQARPVMAAMQAPAEPAAVPPAPLASICLIE
jgi:hypothetical protein